MPVMHVVDMVAVLDGLVTAVSTMLVLRSRVLGDRLMLVVVVAVQRMVVGAVYVVHVIAVLDSVVTASFAVGVLGRGVLSVGVNGAHECSSVSIPASSRT